MKKYNYQGIFDLIESCDSGMTCLHNEPFEIVLAPYQYRPLEWPEEVGVYFSDLGPIKYKPMSKETFDTIADVFQEGDEEIGLGYGYVTCLSCDGAISWTREGKDVSNLDSSFFYAWYGEDSNSEEWEAMFQKYLNLPDLIPVSNIRTLNYPRD